MSLNLPVFYLSPNSDRNGVADALFVAVHPLWNSSLCSKNKKYCCFFFKLIISHPKDWDVVYDNQTLGRKENHNYFWLTPVEHILEKKCLSSADCLLWAGVPPIFSPIVLLTRPLVSPKKKKECSSLLKIHCQFKKLKLSSSLRKIVLQYKDDASPARPNW